ncbi:MAG: polysaccharide pyruvyl transferase family protein [Candidatus Gracilibacteria bacterium]|nr:polysaccharide pyruvyl transferase family protein [Candidatus Gracilibacteria bacterium]
MKISIFASIGAQNLGDELILKNEIKLLKKEYGEDTKFRVFTYDKKNPFFLDDNVVYSEYFPIGIRKKRNIFRNIVNFFVFLFSTIRADLIVIGGGGIIYDEEVQSTKNPLDSWIFRRRFFRLFFKKVYFFRVGINISGYNKDINFGFSEGKLSESQSLIGGVFEGAKSNNIYLSKNLKKVKKIFKNSYKIEVRDNYSFELLKSLGINSNIEKDPVFYDDGELVTKKSIIGTVSSYHFDKTLFRDFDLSGKKIGLAIRAGYFVEKSNISSRMEEGRIREVINYLVGQGAEVVLLPHSFHDSDELANDFLFLTNFVGETGVSIKQDMNEVYETYKNKEIDICVAMRLHSIILSHVYEIPFIGLSYSTKTDEVLNELKK